MKLKKQLHMEAEWRRRTGHAYAENLSKIPISKAAEKYFRDHKPYGIGGNNDIRGITNEGQNECFET